MSEKPSELETLIDGSQEDFLEWLDDKDLGYVSSVKNHLGGIYEVFIRVKNDLIERIKKQETSQQEIEMLKKVYNEMMKVEEKAALCHMVMKERNLENRDLT